MSKFEDLIGKNNKAEQERAEERKVNPFAALGKAVARTNTPAAAVGGVAEVSSGSSKVPPTTISFSGTGKEITSVVKSSHESTDATSPDTTMQGISGEPFSETKAAIQFQASDQPDEYSKELVDALKDSLEILLNSIDNKELVGDALKKIMVDLKRYPFLVSIMHPEDCQLMVRAVRESYGVTLAKKQVRSTKRTQSSKEVEEVVELLGDMEINL